MSIRRSLPLLVAVATCGAQPRQLSTDHSGSALYFTASMTNHGDAQTGMSRIFRWDASTGFRVFASTSQPLEPRWLLDPRFRTITQRGLGSSSVSADGTTVFHVARFVCGLCVPFVNYDQVVVTDRDGSYRAQLLVREGGGSAEVSANGRYVISTGQVYETADLSKAPRSVFGDAPFNFFELPFSWNTTRQRVADDGAAVTAYSGHLFLSESRGPRRLTEIAAMAPVVNRAGTTVVYETLYKDGSQRQLFSLDVVTGAQNFLWIDPQVEFPGLPLPRPISQMSLQFFQTPNPPMQIPLFGASIDAAGNSATILVRAYAGGPRQSLIRVRLDGSGYTEIATAAEGFLEAVLSGDGKVAYAVTQSGRLLRVVTEAGATRELLLRTAWIGEVVGATRRGSRNRIIGGGFATARHKSCDADGSAELGGVRVEYNGQTMPLFEVSPKEIAFRIPTDFDVGDKGYGLRVIAPVESPFAPTPIRRIVNSPNLGYVVDPPGLRSEQGERITLYRPARPGEVVKFQATGFDADETEMTCRVDPSTPGLATPSLPANLLWFGPVHRKPGLFEFRVRMPEEIATHPAHTGGILCWNPTSGRFLSVPLAMNR